MCFLGKLILRPAVCSSFLTYNEGNFLANRSIVWQSWVVWTLKAHGEAGLTLERYGQPKG